MKIGKKRIKGLRQRDIATGLAYYWQPTAVEAKAGWRGLALGQELAPAIERAEQRNAEIEKWREGGAAPEAIQRFTIPKTCGHLFDRYEREHLIGLADNTQRVNKSQLSVLREWTTPASGPMKGIPGGHPIKWITPARVRALKLALCPDADKVPNMLRKGARDIPGHSVAFKLLCMGREVFSWGMRPSVGLVTANPFEAFELPKPPPRDQLWTRDAEAAFVAAADALGYPGIGFALRLALNFGQREADILALTRSNWREITIEMLDMDRELYAALASDHGPDAGKVMGMFLGQGKGKTAANPAGVQVAVPIAGAMREEVEAQIAAATARARQAALLGKPISFNAMHLIVRDKNADGWRGKDMTGTKWSQRDFIDKVAQVRAHAAATVRAAGDEDLAERIEGLQFLDTRRTCVTRLADLGMSAAIIAGRTGHSLKTVENILKTYLVRTTVQAGRGTVAMLADERRRRDPEQKEAQA